MMATCRACGAIIEWRKTARGHWRPYDLDGTVHFATCPCGWVYDIGRFRRLYGQTPEPAQGGAGWPGEDAGSAGRPKASAGGRGERR
jgi:hypothetical protein